MSVCLIGNFDPSQCPTCDPEFNILVAMLGATLDENGDLYPVGIDMNKEFSNCSIQSKHNNYNRYHLTFICGATCDVDKPHNKWLIDAWQCPHPVTRRGVMDVLGDVWAKTKPVHPGHLLRRWIAHQPAGTKAMLAHITDLPVQVLDDIIDCSAPIDENRAEHLARYFEHTAELWYRMQSDFDYYEKTGARLAIGDLPKFIRYRTA